MARLGPDPGAAIITPGTPIQGSDDRVAIGEKQAHDAATINRPLTRHESTGGTPGLTTGVKQAGAAQLS